MLFSLHDLIIFILHIPSIVHHLLVSPIRDGKEMWRDLVPSLTDVQLNHSVGVEEIALVWVDDHTKEAAISLRIRCWVKL